MEISTASTASGLTVEEMASTLLDIAESDQAALRVAASVELAAFQEYASTYALVPLMVCKGCHGG